MLNSLGHAFTVQLAVSLNPGYESTFEIIWTDEHAKDQSKTIVSAMNSHVLVYFWKQLYHLRGSPGFCRSPDIMVTAIKGISVLVDDLRSQNDEREQRGEVTMINGALFLQMFGKWLFEVAEITDESFEESRAVAAECLCDIFTSSAVEDFTREQIARFYGIIIRGFSRNINSQIVMALLVKTSQILSSKLPAVRMLIPYIVPCLRPIVDQNAHELLRPMRFHAIKILGTLVSVQNAYHSHISASVAKNHISIGRLQHQLLSYASLLGHIISYDTARDNLLKAFQITKIYLYEDSFQKMQFALLMKSEIWKGLTDYRWPSVVCCAALDTIFTMMKLFHGEIEDNFATACQNVTLLASYITSSLDYVMSGRESADYNRTTQYAFKTLGKIMYSTEWVLQDGDTLSAVVKAIFLGLDVKLPKIIRDAAKNLLAFAVYDLGLVKNRLISNSVLDRLTSPTEMNFFKYLESVGFLERQDSKMSDVCLQTIDTVRHFKFRDSGNIISVYQGPCLAESHSDFHDPYTTASTKRREVSGSVYVLVRNSAGKFLWSANPVNFLALYWNTI